MYNKDSFIKENYSSKKLKQYCRSVFSELIQELDIKRKVFLIPMYIPFSLLNGFTLSFGRKNKLCDIVILNLRPYRKSYKENPVLALFYLFSVVAHELKHIKILQDWYDGLTAEYGVLFSEWALKHINHVFLGEHLARYYLLFKGASELRKKRYAISPIELICYHYGFHEAYKRFSCSLSDKDLEVVKTIIDSIDFINRHIEIDYFSSKQAYNRFTHTLFFLNKIFQHHPEKIEKFPQMSIIFTNKGLIKPPQQLFSERTEKNATLIDSVLIRMFITTSFDWKAIFDSNQKFYYYISELSNKYCADAIDYLKNSRLGEVFLHPSVLQDNAAMLIKNVSVLNGLMNEHKIERTSGSVLPLYYSDDFTKGQ